MKKKEIRIFYSWQDDIDNKMNRYFIKECIENALLKLNKSISLEEAERPFLKLDHDTKDIPGIPEIANEEIKNVAYVSGSFFRSPPIFLISCSWCIACMTDPEPRNKQALKKACVTRWKNANA